MQEPGKRIIYADNIKVFLTCMVVAHHAGQAYGNTGGVWLVSDNPKLDFLSTFFFFNAAYMMGLFFFISGFFTYYSLNNKPATKYLKDRLLRLGLPLLIFAFFIFGPLHYFLDNTRSDFFSFLARLHFDHPPLSLGHLWFTASLLAYSLIYVLITKALNIRSDFSGTFKAWYPIIYLLILIPVNVLVRQTYPIDSWTTWIIPIEVAHLPQYLSLFFLGALFNKTKWLETMKPIISFSYLIAGLSFFFFKESIYQHLPGLWSESAIESFLCVGLSLGFLSLFKLMLNTSNRLTRYLSDNSYGIYLFHLLIVAALQLLLLNINLPSITKFATVTILGIIFSGILTSALRKSKFLRKII